MHIAVVGAGIIGVTSADVLTAAGHEVAVFEQGSSIAAEASFAPAGLDGAGCALAGSPLAVTGSMSAQAMRGHLPAAIALTTHPGTAEPARPNLPHPCHWTSSAPQVSRWCRAARPIRSACWAPWRYSIRLVCATDGWPLTNVDRWNTG